MVVVLNVEHQPYRWRAFGAGLRQHGEGPREECGHLASGHGSVGAVAERVGGAAHGDAGCGQGVDLVLKEGARGVGEPGCVGVGEVERSDQERGHLASGDGLVGAVAERVGGAAHGDAEFREAFDVGCPPLAGVDVGEAGRGNLVRFVVAEDPAEPDRHGLALDGLAGADAPRGALGAVEYPPCGQGLEGRFVVGTVVVCKRADVVLGGRGRR